MPLSLNAKSLPLTIAAWQFICASYHRFHCKKYVFLPSQFREGYAMGALHELGVNESPQKELQIGKVQNM